MKTEHTINRSQATLLYAPYRFAILVSKQNRFGRSTTLACSAFAVFLTAFNPSHAQSRFEEEFDDTEKPWQEIAIQLPAIPSAEELIPFETISAVATQSFAIDPKSLTVGSDGVVRYTLVSTSASGAKNISYEGIRCHSFEHKLYAFGHSNGNWSRSRRDQWERIPRHTTNNHHASLALDYFCQGRTVSGDAKEIIQRLKWQQPLRRDD